MLVQYNVEQSSHIAKLRSDHQSNGVDIAVAYNRMRKFLILQVIYLMLWVT